MIATVSGLVLALACLFGPRRHGSKLAAQNRSALDLTVEHDVAPSGRIAP
jgi:hypothetical protein